MRVKKKQRKEKGTRDSLWISKPHSKADSSSRLDKDFSEIKKLTSFKRSTRNKEIDAHKIRVNMISASQK